MSAHVLVTGATGFVGHSLCVALISIGFKVTAMVRGPNKNVPDGVNVWVAPELPNLCPDSGKWLAGVDMIVHCAGLAHLPNNEDGQAENKFHEVNVQGTLSLATAAATANVRRFIFVSSIGVFGNQLKGYTFYSDTLPNPKTQYAKSKWEAEKALYALQKETSMAVLCLRPPMIYGPSAPGNFSLLAKLIAKGWPLPFGALREPRSFAAIDNVVDLLTQMLLHPDPPSGPYLISDPNLTTTTDFIRAMAHAMGVHLHLIPVPIPILLFGATLIQKGEQIRKMSVPLTADIQDTKTRLNWTPSTSMEVAMQRAFSKN